MRPRLFTSLLFIGIASPLFAQCPANYANVIASKIGANTPLATGMLMVTASTSPARDMTNYMVPTQGIELMKPKYVPVVNGAITQTLCLPLSNATPNLPVGYHFIARDTSTAAGNAVVLDVPNVAITTNPFYLDDYTFFPHTDPYTLKVVATVVGPQGPQGQQGNTGPQGAAGAAGAPGAQGPPGPIVSGMLAFMAAGTYTVNASQIPALAANPNAAITLHIILQGAGGGSGGSNNASYGGGGGASGDYNDITYTKVTASNFPLQIVIGMGGAGGATTTGGTSGVAPSGGSSTISFNGVLSQTSNGGQGGSSYALTSKGGLGATCAALTNPPGVSSVYICTNRSGDFGRGTTPNWGGNGVGGTPPFLGQGGYAANSGSPPNAPVGKYGGGGGGSPAVAGYAGGDGYAIIYY